MGENIVSFSLQLLLIDINGLNIFTKHATYEYKYQRFELFL